MKEMLWNHLNQDWIKAQEIKKERIEAGILPKSKSPAKKKGSLAQQLKSENDKNQFLKEEFDIPSRKSSNVVSPDKDSSNPPPPIKVEETSLLSGLLN